MSMLFSLMAYREPLGGVNTTASFDRVVCAQCLVPESRSIIEGWTNVIPISWNSTEVHVMNYLNIRERVREGNRERNACMPTNVV